LAVARGSSTRQHRSVTGSEVPLRPPISAKINLAALAIIACALVVHLWPEWTHDPDLSHAFLMPVACVLLIYLSRRPRVDDTLGARAAAFLAGGLGAAALAGLVVAGLFAVTLDWASPVVDFTLAGSFALLGCGAIAAFADRRVAWVPFNWTSIAAAALWPLCSPLPPGTYARLTMELQLFVTVSVVHTLELLGIAAGRQGNIIELARGTVGIEEACSGVRSLISCVFAGILFSAALTRRPWARILIIGLSAPLALAMNFFRSLLLTLLVNGGVRIEGAWHDATGYSVLVVTAAILAGVAMVLDRAGPAGPRSAPKANATGERLVRPVGAQSALGIILLTAGAALAAFAANVSPSSGKGGKAPDIDAMLPSSAEGWQVMTTPDMFRFSGVLRTDHLAQRTYYRRDARGNEQVTIYVAYWSAGQASVGLVGSHTPDACWPGSGWVAEKVPDIRVALDMGGRPLPVAQHRLFSADGYPQQVWFWQLSHGHVVEVGDPKSVGALIRIALRYGFRAAGDQAFIRISSNRTWDEIAKEPVVEEFFARARPLGLY
jgi:exosortase